MNPEPRVRGGHLVSNKFFIGDNNPPIVCFPSALISLTDGYGRKGATIEMIHDWIMSWGGKTPYGLYMIGENASAWQGTDLMSSLEILNDGFKHTIPRAHPELKMVECSFLGSIDRAWNYCNNPSQEHGSEPGRHEFGGQEIPGSEDIMHVFVGGFPIQRLPGFGLREDKDPQGRH